MIYAVIPFFAGTRNNCMKKIGNHHDRGGAGGAGRMVVCLGLLVVLLLSGVFQDSSTVTTKSSSSSLRMMMVQAASATSSSMKGDLQNPDDQRIHLIESERVVEYYNRNYTWPIQHYIPNTPGWKQLMSNRFEQVTEIMDSGKRYEGFIQTIHSAFLVPNFTEYGFGLARCPDSLIQALRQGIQDGLSSVRLENAVDVIGGPIPWFIDRPDLTQRVLYELRNYAEAWSGIPLTPYRAYGFRLYRNQSELYMHVDKMQTHIISFILHIDSSEDAEPWPIFIEDYQGRTHEVILTPGDMLFYESSKCFHGRPKKFNGTWYSSIFVHYYPKDGWYEQNHALEAHYAVPPQWAQTPSSDHVRQHTPLDMVGTSMKEPDCPHQWCRAEHSIQWSGPGEEGYWIDPQFQKHIFQPDGVPSSNDNQRRDDEL